MKGLCEMIGKVVSHYKILEKLGEGGMGVIYKAEDTKLKRVVALKFLLPGLTFCADVRDQFIQEAQAASRLDHPSICTIHDIGETEDGHLFIVMPYYQGQTLKERLADGPLDLEESISIARHAAEGLNAAHARGIVHRDIKPANLIVTSTGRTKIMDFGIAKLAGTTAHADVRGTPGTMAYMSPEQVRGEANDHTTDIWSLGAVFYEMVTGQRPFRGDYEQALVYSILNQEPQPPGEIVRDLPAQLSSFVSRCLAKSRSNRYQNMTEFLTGLDELDRLLRTETITESSPPKRVAVISFDNQTGNSSYDYLQKAIPNLLITSLEQSAHVHVTTWERMRDLMKQLEKADVDVIDRDLGFELGEMDGVDAVVVGSFAKAGDVFATDVKLLDVRTKSLLKSSSACGEGEESILKTQIDELSKDIARGLGVANHSIEARSVPIIEVTTTSMEAYNFFLKGREEFEKLYNNEARRLFEAALEYDPTLAIAHLYLAWVHERLMNTSASRNEYEKARAFSRKATDKERLYIEASYAKAIENDLEKAVRIFKQILKKYPKEKRVLHFLGYEYRRKKLFYQAIEAYTKVLELDPKYGWAMNEIAYMYADIGDFGKAEEYFEQYASVLPGDANPLDSMAELYFRMGRLDDAIAKYGEALELKPDFYYAYWEIAYVYAVKENYDEAHRWMGKFVETAPTPGIQAEGYLWKGFYEYWCGNLEQFQSEIGRSIEISTKAGRELSLAEAEFLKGWVYYDRGKTELSRVAFETSFTLYKNNQQQIIPGLTAAHNFHLGLVDLKDGLLESARSRLDTIKSLLREIANPQFVDSIRRRYELLEAEVLLAEESPDKAITTCIRQTPWRIPYMSQWDRVLAYNLPFLKDTLARAYVAKEESDQAIEEYKRILTFDADAKRCGLIQPRYHYRLARLYEDAGYRVDALKEYQKFLRLWQHADKEAPEVAEARARVEALTTRS